MEVATRYDAASAAPVKRLENKPSGNVPEAKIARMFSKTYEGGIRYEIIRRASGKVDIG